jgi:actin-related protein 6
LDVGGRLLTNYLNEILSFRHLDLKNSDRLIKQIKEDLGFVSSSLIDDMRCKKGTFLKHFILPDDELKKKGYAVDILDESTH